MAHDMAKRQSLAGEYRGSMKNIYIPKDFSVGNE